MSTSPQPTLAALLQSALDTLSTLHLQLTNLHQAILAPVASALPPSPDGTLLVPGPQPGQPTFITDASQNTWQLSPVGPAATPTLLLNGYPDPFTGPATLALYLADHLYFQRITGQWYLWDTTTTGSHWLPTTDPRGQASHEWGPPALRAADTSFDWLPLGLRINHDLLADLFADTSLRASTFLPSPIPLVCRPRGATFAGSADGSGRPPTFQRSDNTFLLAIWGPTTPVTLQFPGLRPTFVRLWDGLASLHTAGLQPLRVATGTDTISVPSADGSFHIIELTLG